jgi:hypothetical protein
MSPDLAVWPGNRQTVSHASCKTVMQASLAKIGEEYDLFVAHKVISWRALRL